MGFSSRGWHPRGEGTSAGRSPTAGRGCPGPVRPDGAQGSLRSCVRAEFVVLLPSAVSSPLAMVWARPVCSARVSSGMWVPAVGSLAWRRVGKLGARGEVVRLVGQVDSVVGSSSAERDVAGFPVQPAAAEEQGGVGGEASGLVDGDRVAEVEAAGGEERRAERDVSGGGAHDQAAAVRLDGDDAAGLSVEDPGGAVVGPVMTWSPTAKPSACPRCRRPAPAVVVEGDLQHRAGQATGVAIRVRAGCSGRPRRRAGRRASSTGPDPPPDRSPDPCRIVAWPLAPPSVRVRVGRSAGGSTRRRRRADFLRLGGGGDVQPVVRVVPP